MNITDKSSFDAVYDKTLSQSNNQDSPKLNTNSKKIHKLTKTTNSVLKTIEKAKKIIPFTTTTDGRLTIQFTPDSKQTENAIYAFFDQDCSQIYIGKTGKLKARIASHVHSLNTGGKEKVYKTIQQNPEKYSMAILEKGCTDLEQKEKKWIEKISPNKLLNSNSGGGGGGKRLPAKSSKQTIPNTPDTYYPVKQTIENKLQCNIPNEEAKKSNVVYVIKKIDKNQPGKIKKYVGATGRPIKDRINEHLYNASKGLPAPLYTDMKRSPNTFQVGILANNIINLAKGEKNAIQQATVQGPIYNKTKGGNGPSVTQKPSYQKNLFN